MASESRKSSEKTGKTFDVSKPGKSMPSSTSRPSIIGHRTLLQDPMVTPTAEPKEDDTITVKTTAKTILVPTKEAVAEAQSEEEKPKKSHETDQKEDQPAEPTEVETKEPEEETKKPEVSESQPDEKPAEPTEADTTEADETNNNEDSSDTAKPSAEADKITNKKMEEELAKAAVLEKLVTDKTYYAPIGVKKMKKSKHNRLVWVVLVILLALVLGDLLIDSGTVKTDIKPPIRFFNNG